MSLQSYGSHAALSHVVVFISSIDSCLPGSYSGVRTKASADRLQFDGDSPPMDPGSPLLAVTQPIRGAPDIIHWRLCELRLSWGHFFYQDELQTVSIFDQSPTFLVSGRQRWWRHENEHDYPHTVRLYVKWNQQICYRQSSRWVYTALVHISTEYPPGEQSNNTPTRLAKHISTPSPRGRRLHFWALLFGLCSKFKTKQKQTSFYLNVTYASTAGHVSRVSLSDCSPPPHQPIKPRVWVPISRCPWAHSRGFTRTCLFPVWIEALPFAQAWGELSTTRVSFVKRWSFRTPHRVTHNGIPEFLVSNPYVSFRR